MKTYGDILGLWKTRADAAPELGLKADTLRKCVVRGRFPAHLLRRLWLAARARPGGAGLSAEMILEIAERAGGDAARRRRRAPVRRGRS